MFTGQSLEASILFLAGIIPGAKPVFSPSDDTHAGNLLPVQLAFPNPSNARSTKRTFAAGLRRSPTCEQAPCARTSSVSQHVRAKRSAFGALVSFIEVPQSIEVPLQRNLQLPSFLSSSFRSFLKPTRKLHERLCRSLPFEALSPKRASNDHANPRSQGSITDNQ